MALKHYMLTCDMLVSELKRFLLLWLHYKLCLGKVKWFGFCIGVYAIISTILLMQMMQFDWLRYYTVCNDRGHL